MFKPHHFLLILLEFSFIYALSVIFVCFIFIMEIPYDGEILCVSLKLHIQWRYVGGLKSAMVGVSALQKMANTQTRASLSPTTKKLVVKHLPALIVLGVIWAKQFPSSGQEQGLGKVLVIVQKRGQLWATNS